jgi:hypothetical protein
MFVSGRKAITPEEALGLALFEETRKAWCCTTEHHFVPVLPDLPAARCFENWGLRLRNCWILMHAIGI